MVCRMRIVCLTENTSVNEHIGSEHGLSLYIETAAHKILFDMGQAGLFARNAEVLGVDLSEVDIAILSHGHYDHGGGLKTFLDINRKASIYLSTYAFEPHYNGTEKYIGLDDGLKANDRLIFTDGTAYIAEGLTLHHCNDQKKAVDFGSFGLTVKENGRLIPDDFRHEQYLLIEEGGKKILISGCSHKGVLNIMPWFTPDVLIGGFHFSKLPLDETLKTYAEHLNGFAADYYTCHCTGWEQYEFMKKHMKRLFYLSAGQEIRIS